MGMILQGFKHLRNPAKTVIRGHREAMNPESRDERRAPE
jgi:hypothetical protein